MLPRVSAGADGNGCRGLDSALIRARFRSADPRVPNDPASPAMKFVGFARLRLFPILWHNSLLTSWAAEPVNRHRAIYGSQNYKAAERNSCYCRTVREYADQEQRRRNSCKDDQRFGIAFRITWRRQPVGPELRLCPFGLHFVFGWASAVHTLEVPRSGWDYLVTCAISAPSHAP